MGETVTLPFIHANSAAAPLLRRVLSYKSLGWVKTRRPAEYRSPSPAPFPGNTSLSSSHGSLLPTQTDEEEGSRRTPDPPNAAPDGYQLDTGVRPWCVAAGCFCITISTYGLLSAMGLLQTHLREVVLPTTSGPSIALLSAVFGFLDLFCGQFFGVLFDLYGTAILLPASSAVYVAGLLGLAFAQTFAQTMGCVVVAGVGVAAPTMVAFCVLGQWFEQRVGLATGLVTAGAGVGGILFSMMLRPLLRAEGWRVAVLAVVLVVTVLMALANVLVASRTAGTVTFRWGVVTECFRNARFWVFLVAIFMFEMVLFIMWGSIPAYAVATGVGDQFYLTMAYNVGAIVGRVCPPAVSDRIGALNTTVAMTVFTLATVLGLWLPFGARSTPALYVVVVLMGIGTGSFSPLPAACLNKICDDPKTKFGTWFGSAYMVVSVSSLIGNPVTETLLARYGPDGLMAFLGGALGLSLVSVLVVRWMTVGWAVGVKA